MLGSGTDNDEGFITDAYYEMKDYYDSNVGYIERRAKKFDYELKDVFTRRVGSHHPKMQEVYKNNNFDFMEEWYKGNDELEKLKKKMDEARKKVEALDNPSESVVRAYRYAKEKFENERRDFVNDMLELD